MSLSYGVIFYFVVDGCKCKFELRVCVCVCGNGTRHRVRGVQKIAVGKRASEGGYCSSRFSAALTILSHFVTSVVEWEWCVPVGHLESKMWCQTSRSCPQNLQTIGLKLLSPHHVTRTSDTTPSQLSIVRESPLPLSHTRAQMRRCIAQP